MMIGQIVIAFLAGCMLLAEPVLAQQGQGIGDAILVIKQPGGKVETLRVSLLTCGAMVDRLGVHRAMCITQGVKLCQEIGYLISQGEKRSILEPEATLCGIKEWTK